MLGIRRLILNLHAQAADIDIYDFFLSKIRAAPNTVQDIRPVQRCAWILKKALHDLKFYLC